MVKKGKIEIARKNWITASMLLGFKIFTPYSIIRNGIQKEAFAFLPNYGSINGVIVGLTSPPRFEIDKEIVQWAKENNCFYSFLNIERVLDYDPSYFLDALEDWGKFDNHEMSSSD